MFEEFENNPKIKISKDLFKAATGLGKDFKWLSEPFKAMQTSILEGIKRLDKGIAMAPIKTIGKWSAIGAISCTTYHCWGGSVLKNF